MKKSSILALAVAPLVLGASMAVQAQSVSTDPVGFVKASIPAEGAATVGVSLVNPAVAAGIVASNTADSITLEGEVGSLENGSYYVEVTGESDSGDALVGERFEVTSTSGNTISLDAGSALNTIALGADELVGYSVRVRPHVTIGQVFPVDELSTGDQLLLINPDASFTTYTLSANPFNPAIVQWTTTGGVDVSNNIIAPGEGFVFRNSSSSAVELTTVIGEVRMNNFRQSLVEGLNSFAAGHPVDASPNSRMMTADNGFEVNDQILILNPDLSFT